MNELKERSEKGTVLQYDKGIYSQPQQLRLTKQCLLTSLFYRALSMRSVCTHYLTSMRSYDGDESSYIYFLNVLSLFLKDIQDAADELETFFTISLEELKQEKKKVESEKQTIHNSPLWDELKESKAKDTQGDRFQAGSLNRLIFRLTLFPFNQDYTSAFMVCCQAVVPHQQLWEKLEVAFNVPSKSNLEESEVNFIKYRVARILHHWLKEDIISMDSNVIKSIDEFSSKQLKKWNSELSATIKKELIEPERFSVKQIKTFEAPGPIPIYGMNYQLPQLIINSDPEQVALQLTIIEIEIYHRIDMRQLIDARWSKPKFQLLARDAVALITRVNEVSFYVVFSILLQKRLRDRIKILGKYIQIARVCLDLKNFNTLMAVMVGLGHGAISRLAHTWKGLGQPDRVYKELLPLANPSGNFKSIREVMQQEQHMTVPYVGVSLSDITFTYEGNPDYAPEGSTNINLPKFQMIARWMKQFQHSQTFKNDFKKNELLNTLLFNLPQVGDKEMYALSLYREPRGSLLKDIEH